MVNPGWADLDRGLFPISVAAELAGLHPQTLRIYEREGLLDPARSAGGTRRYSRRDIDRLAEICALTAEGTGGQLPSGSGPARRAVRARSAARSSSSARIRTVAASVWPWSNSSLIRAAKVS
jgi:hypothetical protein